MNRNDPRKAGEWPKVPPREGPEGVPEGYEPIRWRDRLLAAAVTAAAVAILLFVLWAMQRWAGGR